MLKFFFWSLLCINGILFAYGQGYLGNAKGNEHEPARMARQLNADKLTLVSSAQAAAIVAAATRQAEKAAAPPTACIEVGNFTIADAKRFEAQAAALAMGERQSRHNVTAQEVTSHIVYIPPLGSKEAADKKAGELKALGVTNYFIMSDNTSMRWAISLGVFKSETAAQNLLQSLIKQGVHSARIVGRGAASKLVAYQFRDVDADTKARLEQIVAAFPEQEQRACK